MLKEGRVLKEGHAPPTGPGTQQQRRGWVFASLDAGEHGAKVVFSRKRRDMQVRVLRASNQR